MVAAVGLDRWLRVYSTAQSRSVKYSAYLKQRLNCALFGPTAIKKSGTVADVEIDSDDSVFGDLEEVDDSDDSSDGDDDSVESDGDNAGAGAGARSSAGFASKGPKALGRHSVSRGRASDSGSDEEEDEEDDEGDSDLELSEDSEDESSDGDSDSVDDDSVSDNSDAESSLMPKKHSRPAPTSGSRGLSGIRGSRGRGRGRGRGTGAVTRRKA